MISYELAKELKEAGFPQDGDGLTVFVDKTEEEMDREYDPFWEDQIIESQHEVYKPTLSELIEACGDGFDRLEREFDDEGNYMAAHLDFSPTRCLGKTPEEAVARLWLALRTLQPHDGDGN